jgi:hypothetical protein
MGGNATFIHSDGTQTSAEKIDMVQTGRKEFTSKFIVLFKELNKQFFKKNKIKLWQDESKLVSGEMFNGSTSFIFDDKISDEELLKYKKSSGDLDVIVPEHLKQELFSFLEPLQGKEIVKDITFVGITNAKTFGETIICIFSATFGDYKVMAQVDFELLPVDEKGTPNQWALFSHSSSFDDAKIGVKGVGHKYLIQSIIGAASVRDDIVVVTNKSTIEKPRLKKLDGLPRMLKFSVGRGVRIAYQIMHNKDGSVFQIDGKDVYREMKTTESEFATVVSDIYKLVFQRLEGNSEDEKLFWSMKGVADLINKHLSKQDTERTMSRLIDMLWGLGQGARSGQQLEDRNPEWDFELKNGIYSYLVKTLKHYKHTPKIDTQIKDYYNNFKVKGAVSESLSFKDYLFRSDFSTKLIKG